MATYRISSVVQRKLKLRIQKAAETLGLSESKFVRQAVQTDLDKLNIRLEIDHARKQRDHFKAKYDDTLTDFNAAEAKIKALQERGLFDRIFNRKPKI